MKRSAPLRRTPLRARKGLARTGPLPRKTRIAPVNAKRKAKRFAHQFNSSDYVEFIHSLGCVVPGCHRTDIEAAHTEKRSRGEQVTWQDIVPLCSAHHREQEGRSAAFGRDHGIDLYDLAGATVLRWKQITRAES